MSEHGKSTGSGRLHRQESPLSMAEFLKEHMDEANQTAKGVAQKILDSQKDIAIELALTDPEPPHEMIKEEVRTKIGTFFAEFLESTWATSKFPDLPKYRMRIVRWSIIELLGSHQIGETITPADKNIIEQRSNLKNPFQIGVAARFYQKKNPEKASKYIRAEGEKPVVPAEGVILTQLHNELILPNQQLSEDDYEFFRLLLVDPFTDPSLTIRLKGAKTERGEVIDEDEDDVFRILSDSYDHKLDSITIRIRQGIKTWVQRALIASRTKATTNQQIAELGKAIIPFFGGKGKKIKDGKIRKGKLQGMKESILARSNPLVAAAVNREMIRQLEEANKVA